MGVSEHVVYTPTIMAIFRVKVMMNQLMKRTSPVFFFCRSQHLASRRDDQHAVEYSTPTWRKNFGGRFRCDLSDEMGFKWQVLWVIREHGD